MPAAMYRQYGAAINATKHKMKMTPPSAESSRRLLLLFRRLATERKLRHAHKQHACYLQLSS